MAYDNQWMQRNGITKPHSARPVESAAVTVVDIALTLVCVSVLVGGFLFCMWWGGQ